MVGANGISDDASDAEYGVYAKSGAEAWPTLPVQRHPQPFGG